MRNALVALGETRQQRLQVLGWELANLANFSSAF